MSPKRLLLWLALTASPLAVAQAAQNQIVGNWREPGGSVIRIAPCHQDLCATLVHVGPQAPTSFDIHNPDPALRSQRLCGLRIGYGFHLTGSKHAEGGQLYDPKTGKTYHGEMTASGDNLNLRGYVGIPLFGRSETWARVTHPEPGCA